MAGRRSTVRLRGRSQSPGALRARAASAVAPVPFGEPGARAGGLHLSCLLYGFGHETFAQTVGRYGLAKLVHEEGPEFLRKLPLGYSIEVVQIYTNKDMLRFHKGVFRLRLR